MRDGYAISVRPGRPVWDAVTPAQIEGQGRGDGPRGLGEPLQGGPTGRQRETRSSRATAIVCRQLNHGGLSPLGPPRPSAERSGCSSPDPLCRACPSHRQGTRRSSSHWLAWTTAFRRTKPRDRIAPAPLNIATALHAEAMHALSHGWDEVGMSVARSPICFQAWALRLLGKTLCGRIWISRNCGGAWG